MSKTHDDGQPTHPRVAVDVLQRDQRAVLFHGDDEREPPLSALTSGFDTQRDLLNWWQATSVRTFGHIRSVFSATQLVRDGALRRALTAEDPTDAQAHKRQRALERCISACETAYRDLETRATEWLADSNDADTDWTQIDPSEQRHLAMRPAFSRLDAEQSKALARLWGGFSDRTAVEKWTHSLPAVADFEPVLETDADLTKEVIRDGYALRMLTIRTDPDAVAWRERFAATMLLPAFGVRATKLQAGERAETTRSDRTVPHG